jgi:hypothetical protein
MSTTDTIQTATETIQIAQTVSPVGTWNGTVVLPDMTFDMQLRFTEEGRALLNTAEGSSGTGTWTPTGDASFRFEILEKVEWGQIRITQEAVIVGDEIRSSGTSKVYDTTGVLRQTVNPTLSAVRVSAG